MLEQKNTKKTMIQSSSESESHAPAEGDSANPSTSTTIIESSETEKIDPTSIRDAKEMCNKSKPKNKLTYFDRKTILKDSTSVTNAKESWDKKKPPKNGSFFNKRNSITTETIKATTSTKSSNFENGLLTDESKYLQASSFFVVAKRQNNLLPSDHDQAAGLLTIDDYRSLDVGSASINLINYICDYLIKSIHLNLTMFADEIMKGRVSFKFSIVDTACFVPYLNNGYWDLLFFNTKKSNFCYISTCVEPDQEQESKLQAFSKFIDSYNDLLPKHKLRPFERWKSYNMPSQKSVSNSDDYGILVLHYIYQLSYTTTVEVLNSTKFRQILQKEVLEFSEDMWKRR